VCHSLEEIVRHNLVILSACLVTVCVMTPTTAGQAPQPAPSPALIDELLKTFRGDLQNSRAEIMAKNVQLTSGQAAQFWPMFEAYQKEQNVILDDQLKSVQWFIENFEGADDAAALRLIAAHLERDTKMTALRRAWLQEFQKVLGTKLAVRVMQIDRRLSLTQQAYIASKIPLSQ
jgi:Spy/CpxP family protein refolding chaperone